MQPILSPAVSSSYGKGPKGFERSDDRILEDISILLTVDPYIDASYLSLSVKNGEVSVTGSNNYYPVQLLRIQQIISYVFGVTAIHDKTAQEALEAENTTANAKTSESTPDTIPDPPAAKPSEKKTK